MSETTEPKPELRAGGVAATPTTRSRIPTGEQPTLATGTTRSRIPTGEQVTAATAAATAYATLLDATVEETLDEEAPALRAGGIASTSQTHHRDPKGGAK